MTNFSSIPHKLSQLGQNNPRVMGSEYHCRQDHLDLFVELTYVSNDYLKTLSSKPVISMVIEKPENDMLLLQNITKFLLLLLYI